jgi:hypothetical protein
MQFRVVIPDHVKAGQTIRIHCPDGTEANVKVPKGLKTGDSFIFEMSVDQLNNPQALLDSLKEKTIGGKTASSSTVDKKKGFLDREIVNLQDFALALSVGLIIGLGIVIGFLFGILYVTKGIPLITDPLSPQTSQTLHLKIQQSKLIPNLTKNKQLPQSESGPGDGRHTVKETLLKTPP